MGGEVTGGLSVCGSKVKEKWGEAYKLGIKMAQDIREKRVYADQVQIIEQGREDFKKVMQLRKEDWKQEYKYWQDKGWL